MFSSGVITLASEPAPALVIITPNIISNPLVLKQKQALVKSIKLINHSILLGYLTEAALQQLTIPGLQNNKLAHLQLAYSENKNNPAIEPHVKQAIIELVKTEIFSIFCEYINHEITVAEELKWNDEFLKYIIQKHNLIIDEEPVVEAAIIDGKVKWRIVKGNQYLLERHVFSVQPDKLWRMPWELFRVFKDSGKRGSHIRISKEIFRQHFLELYAVRAQGQADVIWERLKSYGILNKNNRLSHGWRALKSSNIYFAIRWENVVVAIGVICNGEFKPIPQNLFQAHFPEYYQEQAGRVWQYLKQVRFLTEENILTYNWNQFQNSVSKALDDFDSWQYDAITQVFNRIHELAYPEVIQQIPHARIQRFERSPKKWCSTARVQNHKPDSLDNATRLFNVSVYDDLSTHALPGDKLDHDHIPACAAVKNTAQRIVIEHDEHIAQYQQQIEKYRRNCVYTINTSSVGVMTRQMTQATSSPEIEKLEKEIEQEKNKKACVLTEEKKNWWAIAVPKKMHKEGATHGESIAEQQSSSESPLYREVIDYLNKVEHRIDEYFPEAQGNANVSQDVRFKMLGALRYLYRSQVKQPQNVYGFFTIGSLPQRIFTTEAKKELDELFTNKIKKFLAIHEGTVASAQPSPAASSFP